MNDDDDYIEVYEMAGTVIEWDGHGGYLLSDEGDRVLLTSWMLSRQGVTVPLKAGDRLHCWVREEISYRLVSGVPVLGQMGRRTGAPN